MKIAALIKSGPHQFYFTNFIHRSLGVDLVVVEDKYQGKMPFFKKIRTRMILGQHSPKDIKVPLRINSQKSVAINNAIFGDLWYDLDQELEVLFCQSINSLEVEQEIKKRQIDLIIDHGTSIVANNIISTVPLALNLHWGLSPYYRGTHCTEWALVNWDPYNIGVTIHKLAKEIDGGDVIGQVRVIPDANDSVEAINMKLSLAGTHLLEKIIAYIQAGNELKYHKQDFSQGFLTLNRQWSSSLRQRITEIDHNHIIPKMLKTPSRKQQMPIIEFPTS